ncbi:hypothetical protein SAMN04488107_0529 [Geodermatophilus saharensis]|uniref:Uncharacterized protein n=1 Tax=Geodermatophilus saharensis TaxID=1137994 RepID=A0A239A365_9ACTN|nr:hypothetical protein [Geodermatophilus saharensis]SNR90075.1 hypothetical protein SAMN04488107_0529 [Geodermatophilus saharensis]
MIDTRFALAPAGVSAWGALDVRPAGTGAVPTARHRYAVVRVLKPSDLAGGVCTAPGAPLQGTGVPTVGGTAAPFGTDVIGTEVFDTDISTQRTTLGIHSPGRPQS